MDGLCFGGYPLYSKMENVSRDGCPRVGPAQRRQWQRDGQAVAVVELGGGVVGRGEEGGGATNSGYRRSWVGVMAPLKP
jgi:hypothetical protein